MNQGGLTGSEDLCSMAAAPLQLQWNQFFVCETLQVAIMADGAARCRGIGRCCVVKLLCGEASSGGVDVASRAC